MGFGDWGNRGNNDGVELSPASSFFITSPPTINSSSKEPAMLPFSPTSSINFSGVIFPVIKDIRDGLEEDRVSIIERFVEEE